MTPAKFSPRAARDLDEIFTYIAGDNPEAAEHVRRIILNTADLLALHPELGQRVRKAGERHLQIRWFAVPKFRNYLIFFQRSGATIMVIRVLHGARDWTRFFLPD